MAVNAEIAHIRLHVEAERGTSDPSQTLGIQGRAVQVIALLNLFSLTDVRELSREDLLLELRLLNSHIPLIGFLNDIDVEDNGQKLRSELQSWVNSERIQVG